MGKLLEIRTFLDLLEEGKDNLVTITHDAFVDEAIRLMLKHEYSQLPVVKGDKMVGVFSYESLAKNVFRFTQTKSKLHSKVRVRDCMEKIAKVFSIEDDILSLLNRLADKSYVLIRRRSKVSDIITSYDALRFFRTCGEDFLILNDIESVLRKIIANEFDASSFAEASKSCLRKMPKTVDDLEFWEYSEFILQKWDSFKHIMGDEEVFFDHLEKVRKIRNKVCHFNSSVGSPNKEYLTTVLKWLKDKVNEEETHNFESSTCPSLQ